MNFDRTEQYLGARRQFGLLILVASQSVSEPVGGWRATSTVRSAAGPWPPLGLSGEPDPPGP